MAQISWITPSGDLGTYPEQVEFSYQLEANGSLIESPTFSLISGELPDGVQLQPSGLLYGYPSVNTPGDATARNYRFTIRATDPYGVADRTFYMSVNGLVPPSILTPSVSLGEYFDNTYINIELEYTESNPGAVLEWSIVNGYLPFGLNLTQNGVITGYALAPAQAGDVGTGGYDSGGLDYIDPSTGIVFSYDYEGITESRTYQFSVKLYDGIQYVIKPYSITIKAKEVIGTGRDSYPYPSILTTQADMVPVRSDRYYAFQFDAYYYNPNAKIKWKLLQGTEQLFDGDDPVDPFDIKNFDQPNLGLPTGLVLDEDTGWLTGIIPQSNVDNSTYQFTVVAYVEHRISETVSELRESDPLTFTLSITSSIDSLVTWITDSDLGTIDNGRVSTLVIEAVSSTNDDLTYSIKSGGYTRFPQGLNLLSNGIISGRTTFDFYSMDRNSYSITNDNGTTTYDCEYRFIVAAQNGDGTVYDTKNFVIVVRNVNIRPFENLYIKAFMPSRTRELTQSIIDNISPNANDIIYRYEDPYFGIPESFKFLALPGLTAKNAEQYIQAMQVYHRDKTVWLDMPKIAYAHDENYNVKYEVVYFPIKDYNDIDEKSESLTRKFYRVEIDYGSIIDAVDAIIDAGLLNETVYETNDFGLVSDTTINTNTDEISLANTYANMISELVDSIGYEFRGALPEWMLSVQPDTNAALGFTRGIVVAYLKPNMAKKFLFQYKQEWEKFGNTLDSMITQYSFEADRYQWDRALSINYDTETQRFERARYTSFDRIPSMGLMDLGTWIEQQTPSISNINSIDYGDNQFFAVGKDCLILSSRSGEVWKLENQIANLSYTASTIGNTANLTSSFDFAYGVNFSIGDQLLPKTPYANISATYISTINDYVILNGNISGNISSGTYIEFRLMTGNVTTLPLVSNTIMGNARLKFDDISTIERGSIVQIAGIDTANACAVINSSGNLIELNIPITNLIVSGTSFTLDNHNDYSEIFTLAANANIGETILTLSENTDLIPGNTFITISNIASPCYVQAIGTTITIDTPLAVDSYLPDMSEMRFMNVISANAIVGDTVINYSNTDKIGVGSVVTNNGNVIVNDGTYVVSKTDTTITLSSPLIGNISLSDNDSIQFGFNEATLNFVIYTNNKWIIVGSGTIVITQDENGNYVQKYALLYGDFCGIAYGEEQYIAVGTDGLIAVSSDLNNWNVVDVGLISTLRSIEHYDGVWVIVGDNGNILHSIDNGVTWNINNTITSRDLYSVKHIGGQWIVVGEKGVVILGNNGIDWDLYSSGNNYTLYDVTYVGSRYLAVGSKGTIAQSLYGTEWEFMESNTRYDLNGIANNSNKPTICGNHGTILTESDFFTVKWGIRGITFERIHLSMRSEVASYGYAVEDGDMLIFVKAEHFDPSLYKGNSFINEGWNNYDNYYDQPLFDDVEYDAITIIPGYIEHTIDVTVPNQRGGIWKVSIDEYDIVHLSFVRQVSQGQIVTVTNDAMKLIYDPVIREGDTVPAYVPLTDIVNVTNATIFDGGGTDFASPKDQYIGDTDLYTQYLKFPRSYV